MSSEKSTPPLAQTLVEREYRARMNSLSVTERMARCVAMFQWVREILGRQITAELGVLPPEELKWRIALRQYGSDARAKPLIEKMLHDVSR